SDPRAQEKIEDVVGVYLDPPTNAVVLCLDEKTQIQALERTQPILPLRAGLPARQTHDYARNGTTDLYAALEIANGRVTGELAPSHTGEDFLRFLKTLARRYRRRELHIVLDNSSTHSVPAVQAFLAAHPEIHFHFTPTGASWMNMVEAWFGTLTRRSVRRGSFPSVAALIKHIKAYIAHWNEHPTPFVWTKDPSDIIRKALRRGVNKTSRTAHYEAEIGFGREVPSWDRMMRSSPNPLAPTGAEAIARTLTPQEADRYVTYMRPLLESGPPRIRSGTVYISATK
ncbi:MAG: IS630 family transposase, partial [bacterium]